MVGVIYVLRDPRNDAIRYVGQTTNQRQRDYSHRLNSFQGNLQKSSWGWELHRLGMHPKMEVVETCPWHKLNERERFWVRKLAADGCELLNRPVGGIAKADLVTGLQWSTLHDAATTLRDDLLDLGNELYKRVPKNSREVVAVTKALRAIDALRNRLEDRHFESTESGRA